VRYILDGAAARSLSQRVMTELEEDTARIEQVFIQGGGLRPAKATPAAEAFYAKQVGLHRHCEAPTAPSTPCMNRRWRVVGHPTLLRSRMSRVALPPCNQRLPAMMQALVAAGEWEVATCGSIWCTPTQPEANSRTPH
jgi:hypothetical protein